MQAKQAEAQRKAMKDKTDAQLAQAKMTVEGQLAHKKLQLEEAELALDERKAGASQAAQRRKDRTQLDLDLFKATQPNKPKGNK